MDPIKIAAIFINLLLNYLQMVYNQGLSIQLSPTLYNEKEEEDIDMNSTASHPQGSVTLKNVTMAIYS